jgi:hypothetical protein
MLDSCSIFSLDERSLGFLFQLCADCVTAELLGKNEEAVKPEKGENKSSQYNYIFNGKR